MAMNLVALSHSRAATPEASEACSVAFRGSATNVPETHIAGERGSAIKGRLRICCRQPIRPDAPLIGYIGYFIGLEPAAGLTTSLGP